MRIQAFLVTLQVRATDVVSFSVDKMSDKLKQIRCHSTVGYSWIPVAACHDRWLDLQGKGTSAEGADEGALGFENQPPCNVDLTGV